VRSAACLRSPRARQRIACCRGAAAAADKESEKTNPLHIIVRIVKAQSTYIATES
jgi:hypothetical protein